MLSGKKFNTAIVFSIMGNKFDSRELYHTHVSIVKICIRTLFVWKALFVPRIRYTSYFKATELLIVIEKFWKVMLPVV